MRQTIRVHLDRLDGSYHNVEEYDANVAVMPTLLPGLSIRLDDLD